MPEANRTLYLIDGHAQIFRAYYAIRGGMSSPVTGEPTNATFGFTGMLLKLFTQHRPRYVAVAHDLPGKTFRDEIYPQYKANRAPAPEDLPPQIERIFEVTRLMGIPLLSLPGAEADDVIATVVQRVLDDPASEEVHVRIVSKDKDLEQLLGPRVTMYDIHTDATVDTDSLLRDKGVRPEQVVDVLTLMGDTVDNVPGVPGVGPKTAAKLIQEFGSLDQLLAHLDKLPEKKRQSIRGALPDLQRGRLLFPLKRDLALDFTLRSASVGAIDAAAIRRLFQQLGFRRHQDDLDALLGEAPTAAPSEAMPTSLFDMGPVQASPLARANADHYRAITRIDQLRELVATLRQQTLIAVDTETIGLGHDAELCGLSFAWEEHRGVYVPLRSPEQASHLDAATVLRELRPILESEAPSKTGHNIKYDLLVLRHAGVELRGVVFDSMIASALTQQPGNGMDALAMSLLKHQTIPITQLIGAGGRGRRQRTMDQVELPLITTYAAEDADITLRLYKLFRPMLAERGMTPLADEVEMPLVRVLADMESAGIRVDPHVLRAQSQELGQRIVELRAAIHDAAMCDFNIDSPRQLAEVLFDRLRLPRGKRTQTGASTDSEVLEKLAGDESLSEQQTRVPRLVLEYRQLTKLVGTYLEALRKAIHPRTGRVHASFHQTGAATGRLSSSDPNLQNIPIRSEVGRDIRKAFVAEEGMALLSADYSQVELRMLAHLSQDPGLLEAFAQDMDIHAAVASQVFGVALEQVSPEQRSFAKTINFGIVYGMGAVGLQRRVEGMDLAAAKRMIADYKRRFQGITAFLDTCVRQAEKLGYVTTILGRRRDVPQVRMTGPAQRALGERLAINTVVQGSAADLIKKAMVNLHRRIERQRLPLRMLLQIHDELVLECPREQADRMTQIVSEEMRQAMTLTVPLKVEAAHGASWFEAH